MVYYTGNPKHTLETQAGTKPDGVLQLEVMGSFRFVSVMEKKDLISVITHYVNTVPTKVTAEI